MNSVIAGLDIGTSKIRAVIGEFDEKGNFEITGVGTSQSTGLRKGVIVNIDSTCRSVKDAIEAAELMSGREIESCLIGIGGAHIEGMISRGVAAVAAKGRDNREIDADDINRAVEQARTIVIPMDRKMLHVIPRLYTVDEQKDIRDPLNMIGVRLECEVHIITASATAMQNVVQCVNRAGYKVEDMALSSLAAAYAVLTEDERELGAVLLDIGSGTADIFVFANGEPFFTAVLPIGGNQITNDISILTRISSDMAERIKLEAGCCWAPLIETDDPVIIPGLGGRSPTEIPRSRVCEIIQPRMEEILTMARDKAADFIHSRAPSGGVVITGGCAQLPGAVELASEIFGLPVRIGTPLATGGLVREYNGPDFSAAVGLVTSAARSVSQNGDLSLALERNQLGLGRKIVGWIKEFF